MGAISGVTAILKLLAIGQHEQPKVVGQVQVGSTVSKTLSDAGVDIAYSFRVTSQGTPNVATLDLSDGSVAATVGSPTIEGAGEDFEGNDIATAVDIYGILIEWETFSVGGSVAYSNFVAGADCTVTEEMHNLQIWPTGTACGAGTLDINLSGPGDVVNITVVAKSS